MEKQPSNLSENIHLSEFPKEIMSLAISSVICSVCMHTAAQAPGGKWLELKPETLWVEGTVPFLDQSGSPGT